MLMVHSCEQQSCKLMPLSSSPPARYVRHTQRKLGLRKGCLFRGLLAKCLPYH